MRFESPAWFFAAAVIALGVGAIVVFRQAGLRVRPAILFSNTPPMRRQKPTWRVRGRKLVGLVRLLALGGLVLALARPQMGRSDSVVLSEGIDIMMVVDVSNSMAAEDFGAGKTRLYHVTEVMKDFAAGRSADRIGVVSFGANAYTRCPMTLDHGLLEQFVGNIHDEWQRASESIARKQVRSGDDDRLTPQERDLLGTAIGDGLVTALARLQESKSESRIMVLLTDGESNAGETQPRAAAELAAEYGVKVYTIGAGSNRPAPVTVYDRLGRRFKRTQHFPLDEETLRMIADKTGGRYFHARDRASLERVYEEIDELEKSELETKDYREWDERFAPFALAALGLLLLEALLATTVFRTIP